MLQLLLYCNPSTHHRERGSKYRTSCTRLVNKSPAMWYNNPHCKPICVGQPTVWKNSKLPGGFGSLACTETSNGKLFLSFFFYHQVILNAPAVTAGWSFSSCTSQSAQSAEEGFQTEPRCKQTWRHPAVCIREGARERGSVREKEECR